MYPCIQRTLLLLAILRVVSLHSLSISHQIGNMADLAFLSCRDILSHDHTTFSFRPGIGVSPMPLGR